MSFFSCGRFLRVGFVMLCTVVTLLGCDQPTTIDESVIGSAGLSTWLEKNDIRVLRRPRHSEFSVDDVSLRILPLLDARLGKSRMAFKQEGVHLPQSDTQRALDLSYVLKKLKLKKTLLILPKWLSAVPLRDEIYPSLLIGKKNKELSVALRKLGLGDLELTFPGEKFQTLNLQEIGEKRVGNDEFGDVTLYSPQVFNPLSLGDHCVATVSSDLGVLIAKCALDEDHIRWEFAAKYLKEDAEKYLKAKSRREEKETEAELRAEALGGKPLGAYETEFYILSDPDLMNNHGLTLAGNATFAIDAVNELRAGDAKPVFVDTTVVDVLRRSGVPKPEMSSSSPGTDLAKFAVYPFSILWLSGLLVFLVALWRGSVRFGPLMKVYSDQVEASKKASIHAKAHILRLSGQDQALASEFARTQMLALAHRFLGEAGNADESLLRKRLLILVPEIAADLIDAADALYSIDIQISAVELARRIDHFD
ncbi:MAG: hypothetical protein KUG61_10520, partial [Parvibaculaceae bacterium]|nr:hypothetical protein [Parvibaculaceae bacterium]